jgi:hypothetical protein
MRSPLHFIAGLLVAFVFVGCGDKPLPQPSPATGDLRNDPFLDSLQERTFRWFWETTDHRTGLTPDRAPTLSFSSVAAIGFALGAYGVGDHRGYVTRDEAAAVTLNTLRYLYELPQGSEPMGTAGYRGFFYHFLGTSSCLRSILDC